MEEIPVGWAAVGAALTSVLSGGLAWVAGRPKRTFEAAELSAGAVASETIANTLRHVREELDRLKLDRDELRRRLDEQELELEAERSRTRRILAHIDRLTNLMIAAGIEPPPMPAGGAP